MDRGPDGLIAKWQRKIDADFPDGLLMTLSRSDSAPTYHVPRVIVEDMEGLMPVVTVKVYPVDGKDFRLRLSLYSEDQAGGEGKSGPRVVRVESPDLEDYALWSGNLSPELAAEFRGLRKEAGQ